jgi:hypothetical protein
LYVHAAPKLLDRPTNSAGNSDLRVQIFLSAGFSEALMIVVKRPSSAPPVWCLKKNM